MAAGSATISSALSWLGNPIQSSLVLHSVKKEVRMKEVHWIRDPLALTQHPLDMVAGTTVALGTGEDRIGLLIIVVD